MNKLDVKKSPKSGRRTSGSEPADNQDSLEACREQDLRRLQEE